MSDSSSRKRPKKSVQQVIKTLRTKLSEEQHTMMINSPQKLKKGKNALSSLTEKNATRFTKETALGQGGMKDIKLVRDENMKRVVAKATIRPDKMDNKNIEMFVREARLMAALEHPNIVPIYDIGKNEKGEPYFIMKHLDGLTLHEILWAIANEDEETIALFSKRKLLEVFKEICETISYAHKKKILHLDIKPDNIHINSEGKVYVIDWGLSKITEKQSTEKFEELFDTNLDETMSGDIRGTPGYLAPEQIIRKNKHLSPATDVYGLGGLLYSILCLEIPVSESSFDAELRKTFYGEIVKPSLRKPEMKIDKSLEQIAMKALERLPKNRYQNVDDMIVDIDTCLNKKKINLKPLVVGALAIFAICFVYALISGLSGTPDIVATGGTVTYTNENGTNWKVHTFTSDGTFTVTSGSDNVEYLIVGGGGGGGGGYEGGGGGAGGFLSGNTNVSAQAYTITVGAGGYPNVGTTTNAKNGGSSSIVGIASVEGGGFGGTSGLWPHKGGDGASGGGGGIDVGGSGNQGNQSDGGRGIAFAAAGGGGAGTGQNGEDGDNNAPATGGDGGDGLVSSISGTATYYGGGGGGAARLAGAGKSGGSGGLGGGGKGGAQTNGTDGTVNTGGGGGGGGENSGNAVGGKGGSGIVIIRYNTSEDLQVHVAGEF